LKLERHQRWLFELLLLVFMLIGVYAFTQWRGVAVTPPRQLPVLALQSPNGQWLDYRPSSGRVTLTPTSLLVNGQGRIVGRYVGAISLPVILWHVLWMRL
jgi:hypothetical protein